MKLDLKIETTHLALFEQKSLIADRRSKYYEQQVLALREAQEEASPENPESGRDMVLNISIRINETQTQEMIGAKRDFFFKFIEQEVSVLMYQVAQEQIISQKIIRELVEVKGLSLRRKPLKKRELLCKYKYC